MNDLHILINKYIQDPTNDQNNYDLARYYHNIGQTASAVSYYIRTAERTNTTLLQYECLLLAAKCFEQQGTRAFSVIGLLMHAVSLMPKRPEAYWALSKFYEIDKADGNWFRCYMMSSIALEVCDFDSPSISPDLDYKGKYCLLFQKALSAWWCGLCDNARDLFKDLLANYPLDTVHRTAVINNLQKMGGLTSTQGLIQYDKTKLDRLKFYFDGVDAIEKNYSESYQDMFVLSVLDGKRNGTYLEIGAGNTFYGNNTALLEQNYNWTGVALDIDEGFVLAHKKERRNPCLLKDATLIDYNKFLSGLNFPKEIDYLQIDCDPPEVTYNILLQIPFDSYKFAVITYEHDYYCDETKSYREKSRKYLESYGYVLLAGNIAPDEWRAYEDWYVHPDLVRQSVIEDMKQTYLDVVKAEDYMLRKKKI